MSHLLNSQFSARFLVPIDTSKHPADDIVLLNDVWPEGSLPGDGGDLALFDHVISSRALRYAQPPFWHHMRPILRGAELGVAAAEMEFTKARKFSALGGGLRHRFVGW
jgi:hypothetical protein